MDVKPKPHPAKYSRSVMEAIIREVTKLVMAHPDKKEWEVLDCFGGIGGIFDLHVIENAQLPDGPVQLFITSVELEREWSVQGWDHPRFNIDTDDSVCADFFDFAKEAENHEAFSIACTSCTYGNRMADHHEAKDESVRNTYRHKLGRPLSRNSSAGMQWGDEYRSFHRNAWCDVYRLLEPGGYFILNVKDHIRKGVKQPVAAWHKAYVMSIGFNLIASIPVGVRGNRQGENHEARVDNEWIYVFQKPWNQAVSKRTGESADYAEQSLLKPSLTRSTEGGK